MNIIQNVVSYVLVCFVKIESLFGDGFEVKNALKLDFLLLMCIL